MSADEGASVEASPAEHCSNASLLRKIPITVFLHHGKLELIDGSLGFHSDRHGTELFNHPVGELHSLGFSPATGVHIWHGATRYRFVPEFAPFIERSSLVGDNPLLQVAASANDIIRANAEVGRRMAGANQWMAVLTPQIGDPPPGVKVRPPWGLTTLIVAGLIFAAVFIAALTMIGLVLG